MAKSKEYMDLYRARGYGSDFETLTIIPTERGEVKVLVPTKGKNNKTPDKTLAKNRIYANVSKETGHVKSLYFFDDQGVISEQWNLDLDGKGHIHFDSTNHLHKGLDHKKGGGRPLDQAEIEFARGVDIKWREFMETDSETLRRKLSSKQFNPSWMSSR